jgi:hypothetical protein
MRAVYGAVFAIPDAALGKRLRAGAGGFFYADATLQLDRKLGELCSGAPQCPGAATDIR